MNNTRLAVVRLVALAAAALVSASCETVSKKDWAITQNQMTRIDERVAMINKTLSAQADMATNVDQLRGYVSVMTGQIEEFNGRSQMLSDRLGKLEKNINDALGSQRHEITERCSAMGLETMELRKEIQAMSLEAHGAAHAMDARMAAIEANVAAIDEAIRNQPPKKQGKGKEKEKEKEKSPAEAPHEEPSQTAPDQKGEMGLYQQAYASFLRGDNETAARGFLEHLSLYPDSALAANALFWLGESFLAMNNNQKAVESFSALWDRFPSSVKAGPALLQAAESLIRLGRMDEAVIKLKVVVERFPGAPEAVKASQRLLSLAQGTVERR
jgi:tol-pal system protein YbgF